MKHIDISYKVEQFQHHLKRCPRTILSAKFGDGKTYFLSQVRKELADQYLFFTLRPVNYSVATNEDIFEYIKRDILLQLAKGGYLDGLDFTALVDSLFNWQNLRKVISFLLQFMPNGSVVGKLISVFEELKEKYQEKENTWESYSNEFENQRGGLYENDVHTKMIKESLQYINDRPIGGKKTVLVIEDLDRVDPGHMFRILNVLGAHVDTNDGSNKFGFDNIILVLDYSTTERIFNHFYGVDANYSGYMSKFISDYPFHYSIEKVAIEVIYKFIMAECGIPESSMSEFRIGKSSETFAELIEKLSVRDIANALDGIENQYKTDLIEIREGVMIRPEVKILKLMSLLKRLKFDFDIEKLADECKDLSGITVFILLGDFLRVDNSLFPRGCFFYKGQQFSVSCEEKEGIEHYTFILNAGGYSREVNFARLIDKAFLEAKKCVYDLL